MQLWRLCEFEEAWECSMADFADPPEPLNTDWLQVLKPGESKAVVWSRIRRCSYASSSQPL